MKRFLLTILSILLSSSLFAEARPENLKVGFVISLSGSLAQFGAAIENGVRLAQEDNPEVLDTFIPIFEDSEYKTKTAITNFNKLLSVDKVDLIYVFGSPMTEALGPMAEKVKLPMISTEYNPKYTQNKQYVLRFANNAADYAQAILKVMRSRNLKNFGIV